MVSRILLAPGEYALLGALPGNRLKKVRYYHNYLGRMFSIDVFEGQLEGLILCETEANGLEDLMSAEPPSYTRLEVTEDPFFEGANLCRATHLDLTLKISKLE
jgi:CYTH domain-containing protein